MILRLPSETALQELETRIQAKLPKRVHESDPRTTTGTDTKVTILKAKLKSNAAPQEDPGHLALAGSGSPAGAAPRNASKSREECLGASKRRRKNATHAFSESEALQAIRQYLQYHHKVAWIERMNTGALKVEGRFIRFGVPGLSDLIGMLKSGQFLAIEVKSSRGFPSPAQNHFLSRVRRWGGIAGVARTIEDIEKILSAS